MAGFGFDYMGLARAPQQDGGAEAGAGPYDAGDTLRWKEAVGAEQRLELLFRQRRHRMSDRAEVVEKRQPLEAQVPGEARPLNDPAAIDEAQGLARDRRRHTDGGGGGERLARMLGKGAPGRCDTLMIGRAAAEDRAEARPFAGQELGEREARIGAADVDGDDPIDCAAPRPGCR
jgi:hypothetical protein